MPAKSPRRAAKRHPQEVARKGHRPSTGPERTPAHAIVRVVAPLSHWRERPLLPLKLASEVAGVSVASLYNFVDQGRLRFRQLGGRTLVETKSLIALVDSAEEWAPSDRGKEARAKRKELARAALR